MMIKQKIDGFVEITDIDTGEIVLNKKNAVHMENMSHAIAMCLSHTGKGHIHKIYFGNGASTITGTGMITYFPPNVTGPDATLYNVTYTNKIVDQHSSDNANPTKNYIDINHVDNQTYTDLVVNCVLDYSEPNNQDAFDDATDSNGLYVFDELGLISYPENGQGDGLLLTHCIFSPIQKSLNRSLKIKYTLRIYMSE